MVKIGIYNNADHFRIQNKKTIKKYLSVCGLVILSRQ